MGLRCLIGHEYGDPQTDRDRQQQGSEVVVTVEEYRKCVRCGHRRILSENKEVTVEPPAEPTPSAGASWSPPEPADIDEPDPGEDAAVSPDEPLSAAEDDGIILEDEPAQSPRAYGEWPASDRADEPADDLADHGPWPGEPAADSADIEPSTPASDPLDDARAPEVDEPPSTEFPRATMAGEAAVGGEVIGPGEPAEPSSTPTPSPNPRDTELVCPDCGDSWPSVNVSLRPGDICPECHGGYLDEQIIQ